MFQDQLRPECTKLYDVHQAGDGYPLLFFIELLYEVKILKNIKLQGGTIRMACLCQPLFSRTLLRPVAPGLWNFQLESWSICRCNKILGIDCFRIWKGWPSL